MDCDAASRVTPVERSSTTTTGMLSGKQRVNDAGTDEAGSAGYDGYPVRQWMGWLPDTRKREHL